MAISDCHIRCKSLCVAAGSMQTIVLPQSLGVVQIPGFVRRP